MTTRRIIGILAIVALIALTGFVGYQLGVKNTEALSSSKFAKAVASDFIVSLTSDDALHASSLGSEYYKANNSVASIKKFRESVASDNPKLSDEEIYFGRDQVSGRAIYTVKVDNLPPSSTTGSTTGTIVVKMVYENGAWKVDSLQVS